MRQSATFFTEALLWKPAWLYAL